MVKDIKKILEEKLFANSDEERIAKILNSNGVSISRKNIHYHNGIISLKNISSALRLHIIMNKQKNISLLRDGGFHVRDIL